MIPGCATVYPPGYDRRVPQISQDSIEFTLFHQQWREEIKDELNKWRKNRFKTSLQLEVEALLKPHGKV